MADLIDREVLKERFRLRINWLKKDVHDQYSLGLYHGCETDAALVDEVSTFDPESLRPTGEWISVEERLPQERGAVCVNMILLMDNGLVTVGWLNQITNRGYFLDTINDVVIIAPLSRFTHWMPLPEPPDCGANMKGEK